MTIVKGMEWDLLGGILTHHMQILSESGDFSMLVLYLQALLAGILLVKLYPQTYLLPLTMRIIVLVMV